MPTKQASPEDMSVERVFLIDSMSHIFRAFFAPLANRAAPLATSSGQVTQAVYIFTNMLRKLLQDEKPSYIAAIFESKEKTFRHETFAGYKANRLAMPEDLASQLPYIFRLCEAFNIPVINAPGFEADDVIGTLAKQIAAQKLQAVIVSNDKDMCQLVADPYIVCMRTNSQVVKRKEYVPPIEFCDEAWVEKKFGVPASKVVDLLGLMGDAIDNIPGAPGIGAKGAVQVITQFGSIEEALNRWEEVKHKTYRESLRDNADLIRQSRELARIRLDLEVELDLEQVRARPPDRAAAYELFKELEFAALTREFADAASAAPEGVGDKLNYQIIDSRAALDTLIKSLWDAESVGIAIADATPSNRPSDKGEESDELQLEQQCVIDYELAEGIAFSIAEGRSAFVDFNKFSEGREAVLASLREVLSNGLIEKSVHDLKRAIGLMARLDITLEGVKDDTLLAAYLIDPNRSKYELHDLAREAVNVERVEKPSKGWSDMQWETAANADLTARTAKVLHQRILEKKLETIYSEMELPLAPLLYRMERAGLKLDRATLSDLSNYLGLELRKLTVKIYEVAGREFNIGSPKQVGDVLSELEMTSGRKTSTGRISTSKAVL
ncbi:MAG: DNA polymerase, partial [Pyrinomonadaceae bacterium]